MPISGPLQLFKKAGERLSAENDWNTVLRRLMRLEARVGGSWSGAVSTGGFTLDRNQFNAKIKILQLTEAVGPEESSEFRDRAAKLVYYDTQDRAWRTDENSGLVRLVTDPYYHLPWDSGARFAAVFHEQSGKYIPLAQVTIRLVRSVDPDTGDYPEATGCPNVYPIQHVTSSYTAEPGRRVPTHTTMESIERLGGVDGPHGYVMNLYEGADSYIPVGTVFPAFMINKQWWTYVAIGEGQCSSSSSGEESSSQSESSGSETSNSSDVSSESSGGSSDSSEQMTTSEGHSDPGTSSEGHSSGGGFDCVDVVIPLLDFDGTACELTYSYRTICFPDGLGVTISDPIT
jgi:hypothetical protein